MVELSSFGSIKISIFIFLFLSIGNTSSLAQEIFINEIVSKSDGFFVDEDGDASDWVELYNASSEPVDLTGFRLSDDIENPYKWIFPEVVMNPFEYLVIFCSGKNRSTEPFHTNFQIKASGESLILSNSIGEFIDEVSATALSAGFALARICAGSSCYLERLDVQSPGADNQTSGVVVFSANSGVFDNEIQVALTHGLGHEIRYTLDGSTPTAESELYQEPLELTDAINSEVLISSISTSPYWTPPTGDLLQVNVVRAQSFVSGIPTSKVF